MAEIAENDMLRYLKGEMEDPVERQRIESACARNPLVGLMHDSLLASLTPPSSDKLRRRAAFVRHERAVLGRIELEKQVGGPADQFRGKLLLSQTTGQDAACTITGRTEAERLWLEFGSIPSGWEPANIAMFTPQHVEPLVLDRGKRPVGTIVPASRDALNLPVGSEAGRKPGSITMRGWVGRADSGDVGSHWQLGPTSNAFGAEISIVPGRADAAYLKYRLPAEFAPLGKIKVQTLCIAEMEKRSEQEIRLGRVRDGFYDSDVSLGLTTKQIRQAAFFELQAAPCGPTDVDSLSAEQLRNAATSDYQVLILHAADTGRAHSFEAVFESDAERRLWANPAACRFVRFLPQDAKQQ